MSKLTKEVVLELNEASAINRVTLKWIKAHVGHIGNERADEAAKDGALDVSLETGDTPALSIKIVKNNLKAGFFQILVAKKKRLQTNQTVVPYNPQTTFSSSIIY